MSRIGSGTAWAFLVVSDPQQAGTLSDQDAWARETAAANGWTLTRVICGVSSGKLGPRKLALSMIADLRSLEPEARPNRILMIRLERLGRGDGLEAMDAFLHIRRLGVILHTRQDGDVASERASELLMPVLRFFIGGLENEVRRDKLLSMYARRREARRADPTIAVSALGPYGLKYSNGHFVPQWPQAAVVRFAFELKCLGYGYHLIAKRLGESAPPALFKNGNSRVQSPTSDRIRRIIRNERYRGTIVSDEAWLQAQKPVCRYRPKAQHFDYPLGGALRCVCGKALVGVRATGFRSGKQRYYQCRNAKAHAGKMKHHRSDSLEAQFTELLRRLVADDELIASYLKSKRPQDDEIKLTAQLAALKAEADRFDDRRRSVFSALETGLLAREDVQAQLDELRRKHSELQDAISDVGRELLAARSATSKMTDVQELVSSAAENWMKAKIDDRRALAKALCDAFGGCIITADGKLTLAVLAVNS